MEGLAGRGRSMSGEQRGQAKLFDALTTKGTAFTVDERRRLGLLGLLPTTVKTLTQQVEHCWHEFSTRRDDLDKHIYLILKVSKKILASRKIIKIKFLFA